MVNKVLLKTYQTIFRVGCSLVMIAALIPLKEDFHKQTIGLFSFKFHLDQILHTIVYFLICMYFLVGEYIGLYLFKVNQLQKFLIVVLLLAILTEGVQLFVPYRSFSFFDMLANLLGVGIGLTFIYFTRGRQQVVGIRQ